MLPTDRMSRIFRIALIASFALLLYMALPFFAVLLTVSVLVVVTWPVYRRLERVFGQVLGAVLTTTALVIVIFGPTTALVWVGIGQAADSSQDLVQFLSNDGVDKWIEQAGTRFPAARPALSRLPRMDVWTRDVLQSAAGQVTGWVSGLVQIIASASVQIVVGLSSMIALYLEGPKILANFRRIGLLPQGYLDELFDTFRQFAQNVIVGMFVTTASQGLVAALGYWIAGVERIVLLAFLTSVLSQVPVVGSAVVWVPVAVQLAVNGEYWQALFVTIWSIALTGTVDNVLKPLVYRQGLKVHPIFVLIALLAGLTTFGAGGLLVGPLGLVLFLTLWTLYERDVLRLAE